jgi:hypothetical protein
VLFRSPAFAGCRSICGRPLVHRQAQLGQCYVVAMGVAAIGVMTVFQMPVKRIPGGSSESSGLVAVHGSRKHSEKLSRMVQTANTRTPQEARTMALGKRQDDRMNDRLLVILPRFFAYPQAGCNSGLRVYPERQRGFSDARLQHHGGLPGRQRRSVREGRVVTKKPPAPIMGPGTSLAYSRPNPYLYVRPK